jgi:hypothetical protein
MSHRVDAPVDPVESTRTDPTLNGVLAESAGAELLDRQDAVLAGGNLCHPQIGENRLLDRRGTFLADMAIKAIMPRFAPSA